MNINTKKESINILLCYDDLDGNYTRHACVTILSILETNKKNMIKFYILSSQLSKENQNILKGFINDYHQDIEFIIRDNIIPKDIKPLLINRYTNLTYGCFFRMFFNLYIRDINKILYIDCDTIITKDLSKIYNLDMKGKILAGYYDSFEFWEVDIYDNCINSGVLLIDVDKFNKHPITAQKISEANKEYGNKIYADQDYINILFKNKILIGEHGMNYQIMRPILNPGINKATILHCLRKPYYKYSFCPNKVKKLYYHYLSKTKRKQYPEIYEHNYSKFIERSIYDSILFIIFLIFGKKGVKYFQNLRIKEKVFSFLRISNK